MEEGRQLGHQLIPESFVGRRSASSHRHPGLQDLEHDDFVSDIVSKGGKTCNLSGSSFKLKDIRQSGFRISASLCLAWQFWSLPVRMVLMLAAKVTARTDVHRFSFVLQHQVLCSEHVRVELRLPHHELVWL